MNTGGRSTRKGGGDTWRGRGAGVECNLEGGSRENMETPCNHDHDDDGDDDKHHHCRHL